MRVRVRVKETVKVKMTVRSAYLGVRVSE